MPPFKTLDLDLGNLGARAISADGEEDARGKANENCLFSCPFFAGERKVVRDTATSNVLDPKVRKPDPRTFLPDSSFDNSVH